MKTRFFDVKDNAAMRIGWPTDKHVLPVRVSAFTFHGIGHVSKTL